MTSQQRNSLSKKTLRISGANKNCFLCVGSLSTSYKHKSKKSWHTGYVTWAFKGLIILFGVICFWVIFIAGSVFKEILSGFLVNSRTTVKPSLDVSQLHTSPTTWLYQDTWTLQQMEPYSWEREKRLTMLVYLTFKMISTEHSSSNGKN